MNSRKALSILMCVLLMAFTVPSATAADQPVTLVFSTQASADVNYVKAMYMIQEEIAEKSNGTLLYGDS